MAKSIGNYDIIHFTLSIIHISFGGLTVEVQPSRKFDSRKGEFVTPVNLRYGVGTVRYLIVPYPTVPVPYGTENILYRTVPYRTFTITGR